MIVLFPRSSPAAPDFTESVIEVSDEAPLEGDVVDFKVVLRNSGDTNAEFTQLSLEWPLMGYLIETSGLNEPQIEHDNRKIRAVVALPAKGTRTFQIRVLAPRDSAGNALSVSVHLADYATQTETWFHKTIVIDTRLSTSGIRMGPVRITPVGLGLLVWMILSVVFWGVLKSIEATQRSPIPDQKTTTEGKHVRRQNPAGALAQSTRKTLSPVSLTVALMVPVGFWIVFAGMAWRDYQTITSWIQTPATIVGRREVVTSSSSSSKTRTGNSSDGSTFTPEFALRYQVDGKTVISTGYDTGTSLRIGGRVSREQEMRDWQVGKTIPCWHDPQDPTSVVVRRGFGGAYIFALLPVPIFLLGLSALRKSIQKPAI